MEHYFGANPEVAPVLTSLIAALTSLCLAITAKIVIGIIRENYEPCYQLAKRLQTKVKGTKDN